MVVPRKNFTTSLEQKQGPLSHFYQYFRTLALASAKNYRTLLRSVGRRRAPAMGVRLKAEGASTKPTTQQQHRCHGDDRKRDQLLPIHAGNITPKKPGATADFRGQGS